MQKLRDLLCGTKEGIKRLVGGSVLESMRETFRRRREVAEGNSAWRDIMNKGFECA